MKQALSFLGALLALIAFSFWNGSLESRVTNIERAKIEDATRVRTVAKKVDGIYWYLIKNNNVKLPKELR